MVVQVSRLQAVLGGVAFAVLLAGCGQAPGASETPAVSQLDVVVPEGRWIDVLVPLSPNFRDSDVQFQITWDLRPENNSVMTKVEYYGFTRAGYMGGDGWWGIAPGEVPAGEFEVRLQNLDRAYREGRQQGFPAPVLHFFVLIAGAGDATMHIVGTWPTGSLSYTYGTEEDQWSYRLSDFSSPTAEVQENPGYVTLQMDAQPGNRTLGLAFDASIPGGANPVLLPWYAKPDGTIQEMDKDLALDFSSMPGTWTFAMQAPIQLEPDRVVLWGTYFNATQSPQSGA